MRVCVLAGNGGVLAASSAYDVDDGGNVNRTGVLQIKK